MNIVEAVRKALAPMPDDLSTSLEYARRMERNRLGEPHPEEGEIVRPAEPYPGIVFTAPEKFELVTGTEVSHLNKEPQ